MGDLRRILIVDDDPAILGLLEAMPEEHYMIIKACCGEECLLMLEKEKPDLY